MLPTIKIDADSRNIEELNVEPDPEQFRPEDQKRAEGRASAGYKFKEYEGMMPEMDDKALIIDDISHWESDRLIEMVKPDIFCAGIKEKYVVQKMGVPCKQLHSYDYGGPYAAFQGAINFYAEIDRMVNGKVWSYIKPPWDDEPSQDPSGKHRRAWTPQPDSRQPIGSSNSMTLLRHTQSGEVVERQALTINPAKTCQPIGAMYAALGIHRCLPHSHGSQGCCSYHRSTLSRHYKEPVMAGTSSFTEGSSVFGGQSNLLQAINNIFSIYDPDVIAVHTTCLSETIGDDIPQIAEKANEDGLIPEGKIVIHANTPSYVGSHVTGFANMVSGMVDYLAESTQPEKVAGQVNVIPGWVEPADMREIRRLVKLMDLEPIVFPDTSGVLDCPQTGMHEMYPKGGRPAWKISRPPATRRTPSRWGRSAPGRPPSSWMQSAGSSRPPWNYPSGCMPRTVL